MSDEAAAIAESVVAESVGSPADVVGDIPRVSSPDVEADTNVDFEDDGFKPITSQEALDNLLKSRL